MEVRETEKEKSRDSAEKENSTKESELGSHRASVEWDEKSILF